MTRRADVKAISIIKNKNSQQSNLFQENVFIFYFLVISKYFEFIEVTFLIVVVLRFIYIISSKNEAKYSNNKIKCYTTIEVFSFGSFVKFLYDLN